MRQRIPFIGTFILYLVLLSLSWSCSLSFVFGSYRKLRLRLFLNKILTECFVIVLDELFETVILLRCGMCYSQPRDQ